MRHGLRTGKQNGQYGCCILR